MRMDQLLPAVVALVVIFLLPRLAQGPKALGGILGAGVVAGFLGWLGLRFAPLSGDLLVYLAAGAAALLAPFLGVVVRGTVLSGQKRGWPEIADPVLTGGGAVLLSLSFLRMFQAL